MASQVNNLTDFQRGILIAVGAIAGAAGGAFTGAITVLGAIYPHLAVGAGLAFVRLSVDSLLNAIVNLLFNDRGLCAVLEIGLSILGIWGGLSLMSRGLNGVAILDRIQAALNSTDVDVQLEGQVAAFLNSRGYQILSFQRKVYGPNGPVGEIDIEILPAIIEVTNEQSGKLSQVTGYINNLILNPNRRPVILYAPNYTYRAGENITGAGAFIARDFETLNAILNLLSGVP
jgi:hypothetical protein